MQSFIQRGETARVLRTLGLAAGLLLPVLAHAQAPTSGGRAAAPAPAAPFGTAQGSMPLGGTGPARNARPPAAQGVVNINSASAQELDGLYGIGPARARKIIAGRPYASPADLVTRKILPQKVYDRIKAQLAVR